MERNDRSGADGRDGNGGGGGLEGRKRAWYDVPRPGILFRKIEEVFHVGDNGLCIAKNDIEEVTGCRLAGILCRKVEVGYTKFRGVFRLPDTNGIAILSLLIAPSHSPAGVFNLAEDR